MKGRWEKSVEYGEYLVELFHMTDGEWSIYCKIVPYWNSRGNSLTVQ